MFIIAGIIFSVLLFLYSVISFGKVIKVHSGPKIKELLSSMTSNPIKGVVFGTISTAILQSSTAASVLVASLTDAGLISFYNTVGVILGVNIGTTITTQLIAFNFMHISPFVIIFGVLLYFWGKSFSKYSKPVIYFGLLFFAIYLISFFVSQIDTSYVRDLFSFSSNIFYAILIGIIACLIFQSSSVVSGVVLVLTGSGIIDVTQGVGLILGANIGTTSTVIIASFTMGKEAKKVALTHFLFNFLGVLFILPVLKYFLIGLSYLGDDAVHKIANVHLLFNILSAIIFLILIRPFRVLIEFVINKSLFRGRKSA